MKKLDYILVSLIVTVPIIVLLILFKIISDLALSL